MNSKARELMRKAREDNGLKQAELAKELGVTGAAISSWEKGKTDIDVDSFVQYCKICGVNYLEILEAAYGETIEPRQTIECTADEAEMIRKFRCLDSRGQRNVLRNLNAEYEDVSKNSVEDSSNAVGA